MIAEAEAREIAEDTLLAAGVLGVLEGVERFETGWLMAIRYETAELGDSALAVFDDGSCKSVGSASTGVILALLNGENPWPV